MTSEQLALVDGPGRPHRPAPGMSEAQLLAAVRRLARTCGWRCYHTHDSRRSERGYPDLTLVHDRQRRVLFIELKTDAGRLSVDQEAWLRDLAAAGCETAILRPRDLPDIGAVLRGRRIEAGEFGIADLSVLPTGRHR